MAEMLPDSSPTGSGSASGAGVGRLHSSTQNRVAAIAEVTGVSVTGLIITALILGLLGPDFKLQSILNSGADVDYLEASLILTVLLLVQYICLLVPAFLIGRWHRRRSIKSYGLTTNSQSTVSLAKLGAGAFALVFLPTTFMRLAREYLPLGRLPATQEFAYNLDWSQWGFWLFMFVGGFGIVAILEEVFYRGYMQTRLTEDFGGPAAILITSAIFMFGHVQYLYLGFFGIGNILVNILVPIGLGYLYHKTKSLVPSIVMHSIVNIPVRGLGLFLMPAVMLALVILYRKAMWESALGFWQEIRSMPSRAAAILAAVYGAVFASLVGFQSPVALGVGIVSLPVALFLEFQEKRGAEKM